MVKFEGLLMQQVSEEKELNRKGKSLEDEEVEELRHELDAQIKVRTALHAALQAPVSSRPKLSSLPPMVQQLIEEVMYIEEEIFWLERKVENLKLSLLREKALTKGQERRYHHRRMLIPRPTDSYPTQSHEGSVKCKTRRNGRGSICSPVDLRSSSSTMSNNGDVGESSRSSRSRRSHTQQDLKTSSEKPNKLSEELIRCLVNILLKLNKASLESRGSAVFRKHQQTLSNKKSKKFMSRTSLSCTTLCTFSFNDYASNLDPYGILQDSDGSITQIGSYKNFIEVSRSSLDTKHISECLPEMGKLRILLHKLKNVDLSYLTNKQKLAFWINIYNACIMHVFLQHGLPLSGEDQVAFMNKAAINVGGIILNALAIEHFILRHPSDSEYDLKDEKGIMLRSVYGLGYPEPNITFALCRGSWSSPALRIYTHDVVNELERAKVEYLEASVGVSSSKKKIMVPKLMRWHMRDFADDMESLIEWIYSQLPHSCTLKGLIMECLEGGKKTPLAKMIDIQPYVSEFRYLLLL